MGSDPGHLTDRLVQYMDRQTSRILQRLVGQWDEVNTALGRLSAAAEVRPSDGWSVFRAVPGPASEAVEFSFGPAVFNVPERATHASANLFVAVEGRLAFRRDMFNSDDILATDKFSTTAAYFRQKANGSDHIYGAHYDFALNQLGHPVFHSQMRSFAEMWAAVNEQYGIGGNADDRVKGILQTVRVPTAQMDVFSFFLQLCADHLLFPNSGRDEREAFNLLLKKSSFIQGAGYQATRLASEAARNCYRAQHWYPVLT
jgi:hypothetical protein